MATAKTTKTATKKAAVPTKKAALSSKVASSKPKTLKDVSTMISDKKNKKIAYIILAVILVGAILYALKGFVIAAMVNGEPVSRLTVINELEKQSGKAALDAIITRKLIVQEAQKKNIVVSQKDIDAEVKKIESQFAGQGQKLDDLLAAQGLSKTKFLDEVRIQLLVQNILGNSAKVSDKEFTDFLAQNSQMLESETDKEAAKVKLRTQLEQQKLGQKYQEWIANLRKSAKIQYLVNY